MRKQEKERYKKKLLAKKTEIIETLNEVLNQSKEVEPDVVQDAGDKAETSYTKEFLLSLSNTERKQLSKIDEALERIEEGSYGVCQMCNKQISKKRLDAVPWALYCIHCQEKAEEESA